MRELVVDNDAAGRLDVFVAQHVPACSRRAAQAAIAAGQVRVNRRLGRKGQSVVAGDVVSIADAVWETATLEPNAALVIPILFADASVIALDKPAGVASQALRAHETATAANFLLSRFPESRTVGGALEAGLVHRLDIDTSGVLLAARTPAAYDHLRRQFSAHTVEKDYLAIVEGDVTRAGELRTPIARDRRHRGTMRVCDDSGDHAGARPALTRFDPIQRFGTHTLLAVQIATGVMHQIRVHLASLGHPVVGDLRYGSARPAARHLLHATRITFVHPGNGQPTSVSSPMAADLSDYLARPAEP